ncbi:MAG: HEAT repeat domain-containing protein [Sedimentisphaerales bacterium]|jgi:HEAT repeat protein
MNRLLKIIAVITVIFYGGCETINTNKETPAPAASSAFGELLGKIKTYDFNQSRADLLKISDMIREASGKPEMKAMEKQLDDFLKSDASYAAKDFVCRELSVVGTEVPVPALASMLTDEKVSDIARYALERIPGPAVDDALRNALSKAKGKAKVGIINTLGVRGDKKAIDALTKLTGDSNETVAVAAVAALGRIDDRMATLAIAMAKDKATGAIKTAALDAYLRCADRLTAKGQKDAAGAIYKELYAAGEPMIVRVAAARGMIETAGDKTSEVIVEMLKSADKPIQTVAIATLKEVAKTNVIKAAAEQMANLEAGQQAQLISALTDCGDKVALPTILAATKNSHDLVRVTALKAVVTLGDVSSVDMLVATAAASGGEEQKAAQESLYRLRGADVDDAILKKLPEADAKAKVELVRSCEQRDIKASVPVLMKTAKDADAKVRIESIKAMRAVAGPQDIPALIELQLAASGNDKDELEKTVVAVARKIAEDKGQGQAVLAALPTAKDVDAKCSLLSVLGKIGDEAALPVLRDALGDKDDKVKDAAVRALSDWPTAAPAADLLKVAQTSENQVHKTLALRGYVRLAALKSNRPAEETMKMYKDAMALAADVSEKKMVLSGLGGTDSFEAMEMASSYLSDKELKDEAEVAVVKIAEERVKNSPRVSAQTKEILQKVIDGTTNESVREQAQKLLKQGK